MIHPIYRVGSLEMVAPYALHVAFDDHTSQVIDFRPVLAGALYGPLRDGSLFAQVQIDPEVHTIVQAQRRRFRSSRPARLAKAHRRT